MKVELKNEMGFNACEIINLLKKSLKHKSTSDIIDINKQCQEKHGINIFNMLTSLQDIIYSNSKHGIEK